MIYKLLRIDKECFILLLKQDKEPASFIRIGHSHALDSDSYELMTHVLITKFIQPDLKQEENFYEKTRHTQPIYMGIPRVLDEFFEQLPEYKKQQVPTNPLLTRENDNSLKDGVTYITYLEDKNTKFQKDGSVLFDLQKELSFPFDSYAAQFDKKTLRLLIDWKRKGQNLEFLFSSEKRRKYNKKLKEDLKQKGINNFSEPKLRLTVPSRNEDSPLSKKIYGEENNDSVKDTFLMKLKSNEMECRANYIPTNHVIHLELEPDTADFLSVCDLSLEINNDRFWTLPIQMFGLSKTRSNYTWKYRFHPHQHDFETLEKLSNWDKLHQIYIMEQAKHVLL